MSEVGTYGMIRSLMDLCKCPLCKRGPRKLKLLPCQHVICTDCTRNLQIKGSRYLCSQCEDGEEDPVPNGGFSYLPDSWLANKVLELVDKKGMDCVTVDDIDKEELRAALVEQLTLAHRWDRSAGAMWLTTINAAVMLKVELGVVTLTINNHKKETQTKGVDKLTSLAKRVDEETNEIEERIGVVKSLKELRGSINQVVQNLKKENCTAKDFDEAHQLLDKLKKAKEKVQDLRTYADERAELEVGDSVRLKYELDGDLDEFVQGKISHLSVGILVEKPQDGDMVSVIFPENHKWKGSLDMLEKSLKKSGLPYIGDDVKIMAEQPRFGWQGVRRRRCPGTLTAIDLTETANGGSVIVYVDFPEAKKWKGLYSELLEQATPQRRLTEWEMLLEILSLSCHPELMQLTNSAGFLPLPWYEENEDKLCAQKAPKKRAGKRRQILSETPKRPSESAKKEMRSNLQNLNDSCAELVHDSLLLISKARAAKNVFPSKAEILSQKIEDVMKITDAKCTEKVKEEQVQAELTLAEFTAYAEELKDLRLDLKFVYTAASDSLKVLSRKEVLPVDLRQAEADLQELKSANNNVRRIRYGVDSFYEWKEGACTRLSAVHLTQDSIRQHINSKTTVSTVGLELQLGGDERPGQVLVLFEEDENPKWMPAMNMHRILARRRLPFKGDKVRFKRLAIALQPHSEENNNQQACPNGILKELFPKAVVDFPDQEEPWVGPYKDIELVPGCEFEVGDRVWVRKIIPEPSRGWGEVNGSSVGIVQEIKGIGSDEEIVVDFPECKGWIGLPTDLERERLANLEDEVQVKLTVKEPKHGWQSASHQDIGTIMEITGTNCIVAFEHNPMFKCLITEIEPYRYHRAHYDMPRAKVEELGKFVSKEELRKLIKANLWNRG